MIRKRKKKIKRFSHDLTHHKPYGGGGQDFLSFSYVSSLSISLSVFSLFSSSSSSFAILPVVVVGL